MGPTEPEIWPTSGAGSSRDGQIPAVPRQRLSSESGLCEAGSGTRERWATPFGPRTHAPDPRARPARPPTLAPHCIFFLTADCADPMSYDMSWLANASVARAGYQPARRPPSATRRERGNVPADPRATTTSRAKTCAPRARDVMPMRPPVSCVGPTKLDRYR